MSLAQMLSDYPLAYIIQCEGTHFAVGALCFSVAFLAYYRMLTIYWGPRARLMPGSVWLLCALAASPWPLVSHWAIDTFTNWA